MADLDQAQADILNTYLSQYDGGSLPTWVAASDAAQTLADNFPDDDKIFAVEFLVRNGPPTPNILARNLEEIREYLYNQLAPHSEDSYATVGSAVLLREVDLGISINDLTYEKMGQSLNDYFDDITAGQATKDDLNLFVKLVAETIPDPDNSDIPETIRQAYSNMAYYGFFQGNIIPDQLDGQLTPNLIQSTADQMQLIRRTMADNAEAIATTIMQEWNGTFDADGNPTPTELSTGLQAVPGNDNLMAFIDGRVNMPEDMDKAEILEQIRLNTQGFLQSQSSATLPENYFGIAQTLFNSIDNPDTLPQGFKDTYLTTLGLPSVLQSMPEDQVQAFQAPVLSRAANRYAAFLTEHRTEFGPSHLTSHAIPEDLNPEGNPMDGDLLLSMGRANEYFQAQINQHAAALGELTGLSPTFFVTTTPDEKWIGNHDQFFYQTLLTIDRDELREKIPNADLLIGIAEYNQAFIPLNHEINTRTQFYMQFGGDFQFPADFDEGSHLALFHAKKVVAAASISGTLAGDHSNDYAIAEDRVFDASEPEFIDSMRSMLIQIQNDMSTASTAENPVIPDLGAVGTQRFGHMGAPGSYLHVITGKYLAAQADKQTEEALRAQAFASIYNAYRNLPEETQAQIQADLYASSLPPPGAGQIVDAEYSKIADAKMALERAAGTFGLDRNLGTNVQDISAIDGVTATHFDYGFDQFMQSTFRDNYDLIFPPGSDIPNSEFIQNIRTSDDGPTYTFILQPDGNFNQYYRTPNGDLLGADPNTGEVYNLDGQAIDRDIFHTVGHRHTLEFLEDLSRIKALKAVESGIEFKSFKADNDGKYPASGPSHRDVESTQREIERRLRHAIEQNYDIGDEDPADIIGGLTDKTNGPANFQALQDKRRAGTGDGADMDTLVTQLIALQNLSGIAAARDYSNYIVTGQTPSGHSLSAPSVTQPWSIQWDKNFNEYGNFQWQTMTAYRVFNFGGENGEAIAASIYQSLKDNYSVSADVLNGNDYARQIIETEGFGNTLSIYEAGVVAEQLMIKDAADRRGITDLDSAEARAAFMEDLKDGYYNWHDVKIMMMAADYRDPAAKQEYRTRNGLSPAAGDLEQSRMDDEDNNAEMVRMRGEVFNARFGQNYELKTSSGEVVASVEGSSMNTNEAMLYFWRFSDFSKEFGEQKGQYGIGFQEQYDEILDKYGPEKAVDFAQKVEWIMENISIYEMYHVPGQGGPGDFHAAYTRRYQERFQDRARHAAFEAEELESAPEIRPLGEYELPSRSVINEAAVTPASRVADDGDIHVERPGDPAVTSREAEIRAESAGITNPPPGFMIDPTGGFTPSAIPAPSRH